MNDLRIGLRVQATQGDKGSFLRIGAVHFSQNKIVLHTLRNTVQIEELRKTKYQEFFFFTLNECINAYITTCNDNNMRTNFEGKLTNSDEKEGC
jgi:hypothetical protein